eukprot:12924512-Prorocentrum_lima.AAC.1
MWPASGESPNKDTQQHSRTHHADMVGRGQGSRTGLLFSSAALFLCLGVMPRCWSGGTVVQ